MVGVFPIAKSPEIVTYDGKRYQRRFAPARMSNSRSRDGLGARVGQG
jgi:hypothetical protein